MGGGSGTPAAKAVASAGSLAFKRVGDVVCSRFRAVTWSLSIVFEKSNEALNQLVASLPLVSAGVILNGSSFMRNGCKCPAGLFSFRRMVPSASMGLRRSTTPKDLPVTLPAGHQ
jgi:hypothetical protein